MLEWEKQASFMTDIDDSEAPALSLAQALSP
jgi:hypothetical protein